MVHIGNSTWRYGVWSVAGFLHVFYMLWLIGVATKGIMRLSSKDVEHGLLAQASLKQRIYKAMCMKIIGV